MFTSTLEIKNESIVGNIEMPTAMKNISADTEMNNTVGTLTGYTCYARVCR